MLTNMIIRSWREIKIMLKWRFSSLTDADFKVDYDNEEIMLNRLALKLNKSRKELQTLLEELQNY